MKKHLALLVVVTAFAVTAVTGLRWWMTPQSTGPVLMDAKKSTSNPDAIKIGYFHGGRTIIMYRTRVYREFEREGIHIDLMTKYLNEPEWFAMPDLTAKGYHRTKSLGKATGTELIERVVSGEFVGATVGETAFVTAVKNKLPIVAVAELGHDVRGGAGHALVLHKDVKVKGPKSFKGLKFGARRSSGGDEVVLREFIAQQGLDPNRDVTIVSNVSDDVFGAMIGNRQLDGGYGHVMSVRKWIEKYNFPVVVHRALDWIDPAMSQSLLIFHRDYVDKNPETVRKILRAYMRRIKHEFEMPEHEKEVDNVKGLQISMDFAGLNLPEHREIPKIRVDLLDGWQKLLVKHGVLEETVDLKPYVDNSFIDELEKERIE